MSPITKASITLIHAPVSDLVHLSFGETSSLMPHSVSQGCRRVMKRWTLMTRKRRSSTLKHRMTLIFYASMSRYQAL